MSRVRVTLATLAVVTILSLGVVVAFAAPGAVREAASPSAGAAKAVYCPAGEKRRRLRSVAAARRALRVFNRGARAARRAYFRTHPRAKARKRFLKRQKAKRKALQRRVVRLNRSFRRCD